MERNKKKIDCIFCGSNNIRDSLYEDTFFNHKVFSYKHCNKCNLIFVDPMPNFNDFEAIYPSNYQGDIKIENDYNRETEKVIGFLSEFKGKRLLDYGCGNGSFLNEAYKSGFKCCGVEFNNRVVTKLKATYRDFDFFNVDDFAKSDEKFDVIHISNVLEHLPNPKETLVRLINNLNDDGVFLVYGPIENNFHISLLFRKLFFGVRKLIFRRANIHAPTHLFYSDRRNQEKLFLSVGLATEFFLVEEQAWPFPANTKQAKTFFKKLMFVIAKISIAFSKINTRAGNIFYYKGRLTKLK